MKMRCLAVRTKKKLHRHICAQKHTPSTSLSNEVPRCLVLCFPEATLIKHKHSRPALGGSTGAGETLCASKCFTKKDVNLLWLLFLCKGAILESIASHLQAQEIWMWYEQTGPGNDSRADLKRTCSFLNSVVSLHLPSIRDRLDLCNVIQGTTSPSNSNQFFFKGSEFTKLNCHPDFQLCCFLSQLLYLFGRSHLAVKGQCLLILSRRPRTLSALHFKSPWCHESIQHRILSSIFFKLCRNACKLHFPEIMIFDHKQEVPVMHAQICQSQSPCLLFRFMTRITIGLLFP